MIMLFTGWNYALWRALMTPWLDWPPAPLPKLPEPSVPLPPPPPPRPRRSAEVIQLPVRRHG